MSQQNERAFWRHWSRIVPFVSAEYVLDHRPNGGDLIILRAAIIAFEVYLVAIFLKHVMDPGRSWQPSWETFLQEFVETGFRWVGTIFAAVYAALYARFSAQWTYLADLYNQIKATEARTVGGQFEADARRVISQWKAGFIEDAKELHLLSKPLFLSVTRAWLDDEAVQSAYVRYARDGVEGLRGLLEHVNRLWQLSRPHADSIQYRGEVSTDLHPPQPRSEPVKSA
jgi:hypothetical protein